MRPGPGPDDHGQVALIELVNRVLDRGVVLAGELVVSVADIDLLYINLNLLLSSVETLLTDDGGRRELPAESSAG